MPRIILLAAALVVALGGPAWGQANLRPDPEPRVPAQPGQAPPVEDVEFLKVATAMSRLELKMGEAAARLTLPDLQQLGRRIADDHRALEGEVAALAKERKVDVSKTDLAVADQGGPGGAASAVTSSRHAAGEPYAQAPQRLARLSGDQLNREFVREQLVFHDRLVDLYQTQASNTPDSGLASFAIKALITIKRDQDDLRRFAGQLGLPTEGSGQARQYGKPKPR